MSGKRDQARRVRSQRRGRGRGVWVYISAEQLAAAGFQPHEPPPLYRVWESSDGRPRFMVNLYREP